MDRGRGQGPWRPALDSLQLTPGQAVTGASFLWVEEGDPVASFSTCGTGQARHLRDEACEADCPLIPFIDPLTLIASRC